MSKTIRLQKFLVVISALALTLSYAPALYAAPLTSVSATLSRSRTSTTSDHQYRFTTPSGVANGSTITFTFPTSSFTMGGTLTNVTINGVTATSALYSANILTITAAAVVSPGAITTVIIPNGQITNPAAGTYVVGIAGNFGDTGTVAIPIIANDQVTLSANVDASMTFSLSAVSSAFGNLSTGSVATASTPITITIGTNTNAGYTIYVRDQGNGTVGGLFNASSGVNLPSGTALLSAGTEGYGIQANSVGATITTPYNVTGNNVGQLSRTAQSLASFGSYTSSAHTITVNHLATISATTRPGTYSDTLTYVATGNY